MHDDVATVEMATTNMLALAMWLLDGGCPLDKRSNSGKTALDIARERNNCQQLVDCLSRIEIETSKRDSVKSSMKNKSQHRIIQRPERLFGYSYLTLHFEKMAFPSV
jgi:hypothetical protein